MKRLLTCILFIVVCSILSRGSYAGDVIVRKVYVYTDTIEEGTLRVAIHHACRTPGDDLILFNPPYPSGPISVPLSSPIVIPRDCQGKVTIRGHEERDTVIKSLPIPGSDKEGSSCSLIVYSNQNLIDNLSFLGNSLGAAVCLFGNENKVTRSRFGRDLSGAVGPNRYGVVISNYFAPEFPGMDGRGNQVLDGTFAPGSLHAIFSRGEGSIIGQNRIETPFEMGIVQLLPKSRIFSNAIFSPGQIGIFLQGNDHSVADNQIVGSKLNGIRHEGSGSKIERNKIENAGDDGIFHVGDKTELLENSVTKSEGVGIALKGENLIVKGNRIERSYRNGLQLEGNNEDVLGNTIQGNAWSGIWIRGKDSHIYQNRILSNGGCPRQGKLPSHTVECFDGKGSGGPGILIERGSEGILVGGASFDVDRNIIQYNREGGVVILGDKTSVRHKVTHNTISRNYGAEPDLDLGGDGLNENDLEDPDEGPNHLLNFVDWFQAFPLVPSPAGTARYWSWGLVRSSSFVSDVEMYGVPSEDVERKRFHGGGETFFGESVVVKKTFRVPPHPAFNAFDDTMLTMLSFDKPGDTSEFALNTLAGRDKDLDGIVDSRETGDGTVASGGSSPTLTDSDGDGLPDPVEDSNRNGKWDKDLGETSAYNPDSDGDGLSDWVETHGDGVYDLGIDTDPLNPDTDGDGIPDGMEDKNHNGVWEAYLGETNPLSRDSDGDGVPDGVDNCPVVPNPGQEPWYCGK